MTNKLKSLISQLNQHPDIQANMALKMLCNQILSEVEKIALTNNTVENALLDKVSGCYTFKDKAGYFCPNCYDNHQQRIPTKRLNSKLRVCKHCHASITPV